MPAERASAGRTPRLRRADCAGPGLTRRRRGRGFELLDEQGDPVRDPALIERIAGLAIPPAWTDVWICPDERGHLQATGIDAAGRRQYLYHPRWHEQQARRKFASMLEFAEALPGLRARVEQDLNRDGFDRERVLACAVRLLDLGFFRVGCEEYAERNGTFGLASMRREHVRVRGDELIFDYPAKHGQRRVQHVLDPASAEVVRALRRRRGGGDELLAFKEGRRWQDVHAHDVNAYIAQAAEVDATAKDFRTWNATVLAAVALAVSVPARSSPTSVKRAISRAVKEVAAYLGNTPAVCRASYIDPRVFDRFRAGVTVAGALADLDEDDGPGRQEAVEAAVVDLLVSGKGEGVERARTTLALAA